MIDTLLHTGNSHPDLLWILIPSFLSFVAGLGLGTSANQLREWVGMRATSSEQ